MNLFEAVKSYTRSLAVRLTRPVTEPPIDLDEHDHGVPLEPPPLNVGTPDIAQPLPDEARRFLEGEAVVSHHNGT